MHDLWLRPGPTRRGYRNDAIGAVLLALGATVTTMLYTRVGFFPEPAPLWLTVVVITALTLPLAARRRHPEIVAIVVSIAFFVGQQFQVPELLFNNIALFIAIYSIGGWGRNRRVATIVRTVIIVAMFVWIAVNLVTTASDPELVPDFSRAGVFSELASFAIIQVITNLLYFGGAYYFGGAAYAAARQRADLEDRTVELSDEREHSSAQAVALDRVRIARELHDVVAHHVSVMGVQAGAARRVLQTDSRQAAESLEVIEQSARTAVEELQRLLTTLRETDTDAASASSSTVGLETLPRLVGETAAAGVPAQLRVVGEPRAVPPLAGFTLYRIAQEALTNVRKHAGGTATVDVRLRYEPDAIELEVVDTGVGAGLVDATRQTTGLGQLGMRERVAAVGGAVEYGPRARGGYLLRARIPLAVVSARPSEASEAFVSRQAHTEATAT